MKIAVSARPAQALLCQRGEQLAAELELTWCADLDAAMLQADFVLCVTPDGLHLQQTGKGAPGPVKVDFAGGKQAWRQRHGGGKSQLIARAVGLHKGARPEILDATAGLGGDSFVLAGLGCRVTMLEQSGVVSALLADGLQRLAIATEPELQAIAARMSLLPPMLAEQYLACAPKHEVIYLDPMFPGAAGPAAVKKEMQVLRSFLQHSSDEAQLLQQALDTARYRVVVKRHRQSVTIDGPAPSYQLSGKSTRYDIYSLRKYY
jgi:16S rRNA (guanine1516-N2)-methyltransferase